jgi:outer membrane biogenesis lipoprotein LolB
LKKGLLILISSAAMILYSCTGSKSPVDLDPVSVKEIKTRVNQNSKVIESLEASGNISFDSPENSGSGWLELRIKKPDTVLVKIEGPFGISIANALITRSEFIYYNVQENKVITGPSTDINIGAILRIKVSFDELINGFTGSFSFNDSDNDSLYADVENDNYLIQNIKLEGTEKFYIEPSAYRIHRYNLISKENKSLIEVDYSNYQEESLATSKVYFPNNIKIKNPEKSQTVYVEYVNKEINKKDLSFKMKIPKSAKIIKWN